MEKVGEGKIITTIGDKNIPNPISMNVKEQVEAITDLKRKIMDEITKSSYPDLAFLYSPEALEVIPDLLRELLEEKKQEFQLLLQKPLEEVTFADLESQNPLKYLFSLIQHLDGVNKSDVTEKIIEDFDPLYTEYFNEVGFNTQYYALHVHVLHNTPVSQEEKRILQKAIQSFELNGINLDKETQDKIKAINIRLSKLTNDFSNNILKDKKRFSYWISDMSAIKDLSPETLENGKAKATQAGKEGYIFGADPTAYIEILSYCSDSKIREDFAKAKNSFASSGDFDNRPVILEILQLRYQKAQLLGYQNHAEVSLSKKMAKTPETVFELIGGITQKAKKKAHEDIQELQKYFGLTKMNYWDVLYYEAKLKKEKYSFDEKELKKYLEFNHVLEYLFKHAKNFYGVEMKPIATTSYSPDVQVYEVYKNGKLISYYILDAFYRETKSQGAWADNPRGRNKNNEEEIIPVIVNVCNFQKVENCPILLSHDDVITLFHEFGHALHEMLSESEYSDLSGFHVEWDFVELPSQINENWVYDRESFIRMARHFESQEALPTNMLDVMEKLKTYMSGYYTLRQNEFTLLDMNLYGQIPPPDIETLDSTCLALCNENTIFEKGEEYKMYTSFGHIFGGGYAAGYYSYMRAEILEADIFQRIKEMGMFDRAVGEKFIKTILGQGTRKPANELFVDFMGRPLSNEAFMKRKGFI